MAQPDQILDPPKLKLQFLHLIFRPCTGNGTCTKHWSPTLPPACYPQRERNAIVFVTQDLPSTFLVSVGECSQCSYLAVCVVILSSCSCFPRIILLFYGVVHCNILIRTFNTSPVVYLEYPVSQFVSYTASDTTVRSLQLAIAYTLCPRICRS